MSSRLLTDPEGFLQRQAATGRLVVPTLVSVCVGLALSLQAVGLYLSLGESVDEVVNGVVLLGVYYVVEGVALWLLFSVALYAIAVVLGGHPLLGHLVRVVGWGMAPFVLAGATWGIGRYYAFRDLTVEPVDRYGIAHEFTAIDAYTAGAAGDPTLVGTTLLGGAFLAGSGYLWTNGLVRAGDLSRPRAAVAAGVPIVLYVAWKLAGVV